MPARANSGLVPEAKFNSMDDRISHGCVAHAPTGAAPTVVDVARHVTGRQNLRDILATHVRGQTGSYEQASYFDPKDNRAQDASFDIAATQCIRGHGYTSWMKSPQMSPRIFPKSGNSFAVRFLCNHCSGIGASGNAKIARRF